MIAKAEHVVSSHGRFYYRALPTECLTVYQNIVDHWKIWSKKVVFYYKRVPSTCRDLSDFSVYPFLIAEFIALQKLLPETSAKAIFYLTNFE